MKVRLTSGLAALAMTAAALAAVGGSATPASAASGCPSGSYGHQTYNFYDGSGSLAAVGYVYEYSSSVCTMLVAQGRYYGMNKWMSDGITDVPGYGTGSIWDNGYYLYFAGPIQISDVYGALCKDFHFGMKDNYGNWVFNTGRTLGCD
ncbi:hypothetical protein GCM10029978_026150 [Actinoallomurus acanthiterrae]